MLLTDLIEKNVYVGKTLRGVCLGVGISLKSFSVRYLLCCNAATYTPLHPRVDFAVNVSAIENVSDGAIVLSRLRCVFPKNCVKVFLDRPVFSDGGVFLGSLADVSMDDYSILRLFTDRNTSYPISSVAAFSDAVLLKKPLPYPLGQRIHAPAVSTFLDKREPVVTKAVLQNAIKNKALIRFTLSLSPFYREG